MYYKQNLLWNKCEYVKETKVKENHIPSVLFLASIKQTTLQGLDAGWRIILKWILKKKSKWV
jgi:hypothetical protein